MSRTDGRRWLLLGLAALALRAGAAILTEHRPLFPSYYYHDAAFAERLGSETAVAWSQGLANKLYYSPGQRLHAALIAAPYMLVGRRPLVPKLINSALGAAAVVLLGLAFATAFDRRAAFAAAAAVAVWPSHVFYTSQNFKESYVFVAVFGGLALLVKALEGRPRATLAAGSFALFMLAGLLRSYLLLILCVAAAAGALWRLAAARGRDRAAALILAGALCAPVLHRTFSSLVFNGLLPMPTIAAQGDVVLFPKTPIFVPEAVDLEGRRHHPLSPRGISEFRRLRQYHDRVYAMNVTRREIATQIFPDARFDSYAGLTVFLPKAAFHVLFMPLPGLYPMDGKLGRVLASAENVLLLLVAALAALGVRSVGLSPSRAALLAFFALMTAGSALLEFDLGSASRHKLLYLPLLFPFAARALLRERG